MARIAAVLNRLRRPSLLLRWIVLVAVWLGVCAPALSMTLGVLRGEVMPWTQVCRASVVSPRALDGTWQASAGQNEGANKDHGLFKHCACCTQAQAQDLAPPPAPAPLLLRGELGHAMPERFFSAAHTAHVWRAAQARAPPLKV